MTNPPSARDGFSVNVRPPQLWMMRPMCAFVRLCVRWCAVSGAGWAQRLSSRGCGGGEGLAAEGARVSESLRPAEAVREHVEEDLWWDGSSAKAQSLQR